MKIACIQTNSDDHINTNIDRIFTLVKEAAEKGAELVTLPENCFLMESPQTLPSARRLYRQEEHPGVEAAADMARVNRCWLLVGSVAVKIDESGKTVNRSLLFDASGEIVYHYDKIHLFDVELPNGEKYAESEKMLCGNQVCLADAPWGKTGLTICYDVRFPHLYRALAKAGAVLITVPAAFTATTGEAHWHTLLRARAIENSCYIIAPAQTGTHPGNRRTYGHSLIVDPWGKVLADGGVTPWSVVTAQCDLGMVERVRAQLPSLTHDREFQ